MVLYALWLERPRPSEAEVRRALQGNLCRCTGYAPILRAGAVAADYGLPEDDGLVRSREAVATRLTAMVDGKRVELAGGSVVVPVDEDDLADALESEPAATMVAGATDVGVWVNKDLRDIAPAVFIGHMDGLGRIAAEGGTIGIGATASYSDAEAALTEAVPGLAGYWSRIGGWQIRNMGTVGGNIANGSPIADLPPVLIALGAELVLRKGRERRAMPLEAYFLDYGRQDRAPGEFVEGVRVPVPAEDARLGFYKVSKRRDEDISSVCAGLMVRVRDGCIEEARLAFGGMAATPKRAEAAEAALRGRAWGEPAFEAAEQALERDFTPIFRLARLGGVPGARRPEPAEALPIWTGRGRFRHDRPCKPRVHAPRAPARFRRQACDGPRRLCRRHGGTDRHAACLPRALDGRSCRRIGTRPRGSSERAGRGRRADGGRHSGRERHQPRRSGRRPGFRGRRRFLLRPAHVCGRRGDAGRGQARRASRTGRL